MRYAFLLVFFVMLNFVNAQNYTSPIELPLNISGNFGELRTNHFHSGIDIKTNEKCGYPVFAIADGFISRIKISPFGFGKAIYITHYDGKTSVYAHLDSLAFPFSDWLKSEQYKRKSFEMDAFPSASELKVKKGQIIAYSGNSGGSEGPHLHFELRETASEKPINPLRFGFKVDDLLKPSIAFLAVYSHNQGPKTERTLYENKTVNLDTIDVASDFSVGIIANDLLSDGKNNNGLYAYSVFIDSSQVFNCVWDKFSFDESRFINAFIDYEYFKQTNKRIQRTYVPKNSKLSLIKNAQNNGIFNIYDSLVHRLDIVIADFHGNTDSLCVFIKKQNYVAYTIQPKGSLLQCSTNNTINEKNIKIQIPKNSLYDDLYFELAEIENTKSPYSNIFAIHSETVPLHSYMKIEMKLKSVVPDSLKTKLCAFSIDAKVSRYYEGGQYNDGWLLFKSRSFGNYFIDIDTIAPQIIPISLSDSANINGRNLIQFKIKDYESGIKSFHLSLDDEWILADYDAKNDLITYYIDELFSIGWHKVSIHVIDERGNSSSQTLILLKE